MKRLLISIVFTACCTALHAQAPVRPPVQSPAGLSADDAAPSERIYIATDKDNYLSGEIVWMKLVTTTPEGIPFSFSKVGYVELTDETGSRVRERIEIPYGVGEGSMALPSTLPTGYYRLVGYTRWMRNEGPEVFLEKLIGVVNPVSPEVPRGSAEDADDAQHDYAEQYPSVPTGSLTVTADRSTYSPRSEVRLHISGIPEGMRTLSVSVTAEDLTGGFTRPTTGGWKKAPAGSPTASADRPPFEERYEAEYEGAIVTGRLVDTSTGEAVSPSGIIPLVSFPGDEINFFSGSLHRGGGVTYRTNRVSGYDDIVTTVRDSGGRALRINVDDPYMQGGLARPLPTFPLERINSETMLHQSLAMQLQYSYLNDSLNRAERRIPRFFNSPDYSYKLDEWRRFATMGEVFTEFIHLVHFDRIDRKYYLAIRNPDFGAARVNPLVLFDGIPILDHDIIYNYNPLLLDRIDVYYDRFLFGENVYFGIVALYTADNNYPELQPDPVTQVIAYPSPQARRLFYSPDYTDPAARTSRVPDFRHTLHWDADVATDGNGGADVRFFTSDLTGSYQALIEGITASGEPLSAVCEIEVR